MWAPRELCGCLCFGCVGVRGVCGLVGEGCVRGTALEDCMYSLCHCVWGGVRGSPREPVGSGWGCVSGLCVSADGESCGEGRAPGGRCWLCWGYGRGRAGVPWRRRTRAGQVGARRQRADAGPCCALVLGRRCVPTGLHVALCARVFRSSRRCVLYLQTWGGEARAQPRPFPLGPASISLSHPLLIPHRTSVSAEPSARDTRLPPLPLPREEPGCGRPGEAADCLRPSECVCIGRGRGGGRVRLCV